VVRQWEDVGVEIGRGNGDKSGRGGANKRGGRLVVPTKVVVG
jgi:hypothetical protein